MKVMIIKVYLCHKLNKAEYLRQLNNKEEEKVVS